MDDLTRKIGEQIQKSGLGVPIPAPAARPFPAVQGRVEAPEGCVNCKPSRRRRRVSGGLKMVLSQRLLIHPQHRPTRETRFQKRARHPKKRARHPKDGCSASRPYRGLVVRVLLRGGVGSGDARPAGFGRVEDEFISAFVDPPSTPPYKRRLFFMGGYGESQFRSGFLGICSHQRGMAAMRVRQSAGIWPILGVREPTGP